MRVSVTELCQLRCRYCMPSDGVKKRAHGEMMTEDETVRAVEAAARLGVKKIRITGGEPLVKKNILSLCRRVKAVSGIEELCLTTNGVALEPICSQLIDAGVSKINISLDTLDPKKYETVTRRDMYAAATAGLRAALSAPFEAVKLNCVLIGGFNDDEPEAFAALARDNPIDVRFIELMPMYDGGDYGRSAYIPVSSLKNRLSLTYLCNDGVARMYKTDGARGRIGLISPISSHFCAECRRIRLTADGHIKPCLHSPFEYSIRGLSQEQMTDAIKRAISEKPQSRPPLSYSQRSAANRQMNEIGG